MALDLMPPPEALTAHQARPVAHTARLLGGEHAFQVLRTFRESTDPAVLQELAEAWDRFDPRTYAEDILGHMPLDGVQLTVGSPEQLSALTGIGSVPLLRCVGDFPADELSPALRCAAPRELTLEANDRLPDVEFLLDCVPELSGLVLSDCGGLVDYEALSVLPLRSLTLQDMPSGPDLAPLSGITTLREAAFVWHRRGPARRLSLPDVPFASGLEQLSFDGNLTLQKLLALTRWPRLTSLDLGNAPVPARELGVLSRLPRLRNVALVSVGLCRPEPGHISPLRAVTTAVVETYESQAHCTTDELRRTFPSLHTLRLHIAAGRKSSTVDLSALAGIPDLRVHVSSSGRNLHVTGADALPEGSVRILPRGQEAADDAPKRAFAWRRRAPRR